MLYVNFIFIDKEVGFMEVTAYTPKHLYWCSMTPKSMYFSTIFLCFNKGLVVV